MSSQANNNILSKSKTNSEPLTTKEREELFSAAQLLLNHIEDLEDTQSKLKLERSSSLSYGKTSNIPIKNNFDSLASHNDNNYSNQNEIIQDVTNNKSNINSNHMNGKLSSKPVTSIAVKRKYPELSSSCFGTTTVAGRNKRLFENASTSG